MASEKYYAGIGSRKCPVFAKKLATETAAEMFHRDFILRSGGADGMDKAFELGHDMEWVMHHGEPKKEIWLPEKGFNKSTSPLYQIHPDAFRIAKRIHPNWKACDNFSRSAHARNCHQILGGDLKTPVRAVICYTEGAELVGGTRTALVLAGEFGIPIFNFGDTSKTNQDLINFIDQVS